MAIRDRSLPDLGFVRGCLPPFGHVIADRPRGGDDLLFWQFPARTEAAAQANHAGGQAVALEADTLPFALHPWRLYALNVEDPERRAGLTIGRDPAAKRYLASFVGAHLGFYPSDVRLRLQALAGDARFAIRINRDKWHLQDVVFGHQAGGESLAESYRIDERVTEYNRILSESVFALCPPGAGPNSLRLWEALAAGTIPVLFEPEPALPRGGSLPEIDWDGIVLHAPSEPIAALPAVLEAIPREEVPRRQHAAIAAFALVRAQRCFGDSLQPMAT